MSKLFELISENIKDFELSYQKDRFNFNIDPQSVQMSGWAFTSHKARITDHRNNRNYNFNVSTYPDNCSIVILSNVRQIASNEHVLANVLFQLSFNKIEEDGDNLWNSEPTLIQATVNSNRHAEMFMSLGFEKNLEYISNGSGSTIQILTYRYDLKEWRDFKKSMDG